MEPEMVSTTVNNAPAFLQLRDQYKQELVEDTRLTKAADLAAKQHVLLTSDAISKSYDFKELRWFTGLCTGWLQTILVLNLKGEKSHIT